jgi:hypothetical protein
MLSELSESASEHKAALTVFLMPRSPMKPSKGSTNPYGSFGEASNLSKRQEVIMSEDAPSASATSKPTSGSNVKTQATSSAYPFVPQCFASASDCMSGTGNCTGHGECVKKAGSSSKDEPGSSDCYVCSCNKPEVVKKDGLTKTTYFGGSACQKKDISAPFWILTVTTGSLIAMVAFGVGMLYSMGNVELPSVIGAGVSGPRPK